MRAYAIEALSKAIPRILCLLDKNPLSSSYGCLDRRYWQYKMQDFPSAMQQELSRVLAWAWAFPGTRWHGAPRLATYARAAVNFTARIARHDGSLDDYFPYERALGATAYAAAAVTDACRLLGFKPEGETLAGLARMGHFLARHRERGVLTNHHAIAALALFDLAAMLNDSTLRHAGEEKIALLKALQSKEGWFPEYEGCDIGYQTVTLEFLARLAHCHPGSVPLCILERLLSFLRNFVHPDGSLGGEYGSRNTYNFYPGGFALLSSTSNDAAAMLGFYLASVHSNTINYLDDDGAFGHILSSLVTTMESDCRIIKPKLTERIAPWVHYYPNAKLWRGGMGQLTCFGNISKGGAFKLFRRDLLECSDTGYAGQLNDGRIFCQNMPSASTGVIHEQDGCITVEVQGTAREPSRSHMTLISMLGLRVLCLMFGHFAWFSRTIRTLMQRLLIYYKRDVPVTVKRTVRIDTTGITVTDKVSCTGRQNIEKLFCTPDDTGIHVVTSNAFQQANLLEWMECSTIDGREFCQERFFPAQITSEGTE